MGPAQQRLEAEFGAFSAGRRLYFDDGYQAGLNANQLAETRFKGRLALITNLLCEVEVDGPTAEQMALAGHLPQKDCRNVQAAVSRGPSAAQCFTATLVDEAEEIVAWMAGYMDGDVARLQQAEAVRTPGRRQRPLFAL